MDGAALERAARPADELGADLTPAGAVEEYRSLRAEIDRRSTAQQAIIGLQLTASAALTGVAASHAGDAAVLLIIGPLSLLLLLQWLDHHRQIARIGLYLRTYVEPRVGLGWEQWINAHDPGRLHKWVWLVPFYLLFPGVVAVALVSLPLLTTSRPTVGVVFWSVDVLLGVVCAGLLVYHSRWSATEPL